MEVVNMKKSLAKIIALYWMNGDSLEHESRQISSSEDRCKCAQCKIQFDLQLHHKKPLSSIYLYRHLKKREGPPDKKESNKDASQKSKPPKADLQSKPATPTKHKPDRSKEAHPGVLPPQYHMVSHSQRAKLTKEGHFETRRDERLRIKVRSNQEDFRLAEISQNPENIKIETRHVASSERARVEASPSGVKLATVESCKPMVDK